MKTNVWRVHKEHFKTSIAALFDGSARLQEPKHIESDVVVLPLDHCYTHSLPICDVRNAALFFFDVVSNHATTLPPYLCA